MDFGQKRERDPQEEGTPDINVTRRTADLLAQRAIERIHKAFDQTTGVDRLPYHGVRHTQGVRERTRLILNALTGKDGVRVTQRDLIIGDLASAAHDLVQEWNITDSAKKRLTVEDWRENKDTPGNVTRNRFRRTNEQASGAMMAGWIEEQEVQDKKRAFTLDERSILLKAILATYPEFDPQRGTVWQPYLKPGSHHVAFALAMADLGEAGMSENSQDFLDSGDAEFIESQALDMLDLDATKLNSEQKKQYRDRMMGWTAFQPTFARGQQTMFDEKIAGLPDGAKQRVRELFRFFDQSIQAASNRTAKREKMSFEELYEDMGFNKLR